MVVCSRKSQVADVMKFLSAAGFLRFLLSEEGYHVESGGVLVAETESAARDFIAQYREFEDVRIAKSLGENCLNYEVIIHHYMHGEKKDKILHFLNRKNGFPIVLVDGIVPDFLRNANFIILLKPGERGVEMVREKYKKLRRYIIEECEYVRKNLQVLRQSKKYRQMKGNNEKTELFEIMMAVAEIWRLYESVKFQE